MTSFPETLARSELGRKQVLDVEDWAEIRRLRRAAQRLPRDHYVRLDANDYSVHPSVIGRRIDITTDLHRVRVFCDGRLVADHERWDPAEVLRVLVTRLLLQFSGWGGPGYCRV